MKVLKSLSDQATNKQYKFKWLYRNLYNPEFYFLAYKNISQSQGSMTPGVDGKSLDGMSESRICKLIDSLKDFSYQPNPARRVYIEKKNSTKKRPLGIPSTEDKLVQEVVRIILESIYEPSFSNASHGFRPKRSCHTALQQIQKQFTGISWFGDIHACFDSFDHHQATPSLSQAQRLKKQSQEGTTTLDSMCEIMNEVKKEPADRVIFQADSMRKYFPKTYTNRQMEVTINVNRNAGDSSATELRIFAKILLCGVA